MIRSGIIIAALSLLCSSASFASKAGEPKERLVTRLDFIPGDPGDIDQNEIEALKHVKAAELPEVWPGISYGVLDDASTSELELVNLILGHPVLDTRQFGDPDDLITEDIEKLKSIGPEVIPGSPDDIDVREVEKLRAVN